MEKYKIDTTQKIFNFLIEINENNVVEPISKNKKRFELIFESVLKYKIEIKNSWLNKTFYNKNTKNDFPWHNEKGVGYKTVTMPGKYSGICWISGEENCGGSLDILKSDGEIKNIPFEIGSFIVFEADVLHRVNQYFGSIPRISLNITFDKK
jgi:hypothetical protein